MSNISRNTYKMKNVDIEELKKHGFRYDRLRSFDGESIYTYCFSVYKYKRQSVIDCVLNISSEGNVIINVYTKNGVIYSPFYNEENTNYNIVLDSVNKKIQKELRELGITKEKKVKKNVPNR